MGTSTQLEALGETLTVRGTAEPPAPGASESEPGASGEQVSSASGAEFRTLDSGVDSGTGSGTGSSPGGASHERSPAPSSLPLASTVELGSACLSDDAILQYRQGELTLAQLDGVDRHLDHCARCRELVELVIAEDAPDSSRPVMMFQRGFVVAQRYEIEQFVGKGGMGEVYAATDQMTGRRVALKTVLCTATDDLRAVRKLLDEVVNAQRVAHPHVFKIYDLHEHRDELRGRIPFFTMELIDGQSLRARLKREGVLPLAEARILARQLLAGLSAAHAKGVLHLDFKVDNVMLRNPGGEAVIMDFGLSRASDMQSRQRTSERLQGAGTLPYMSLEQLECRPDLGPASDVYSFGVVLYEVLAGRLPFAAPSFRAILHAQLRERPPPLSQFAPVSPELEAFVLKCLARAPEERFADAAQALTALEQLPSWERGPRQRARWLGAAAVLATVLVSLVVLSGVLRAPRHPSLSPERGQSQPPQQQAAALAPAARPAPAVSLEPSEAVQGVGVRLLQDEAAGVSQPRPEPAASARSRAGALAPARAGSGESTRAERMQDAPESSTAGEAAGKPAAGAASKPAAGAPSKPAAGAPSKPAAGAPGSAGVREQRAGEARGAAGGRPTPARPAGSDSDWQGPPPQRVPRPRPL